jgi:hypothetical protein
MMDSEPNPFHSIHFGNNPKKRQMEKERAESIYLANQRLAKKMHHILHRKENKTLAAAADGSNSPCLPPASPSAQEQQIPPPSSSSSSTRPARVHMPGIRLDATQMPIIDCHLAPEVAIGRGVACRKESLLNQGIEKRRRQKIERENKRMKQRIASQKPFYNAKKWDQEWEETVEKFSHLHHDGTVGYLPPKTPMTSCGGRMKSPLKEHTQELEEALDSPTVSYNIKSQSTASSTDSIHTHAPKKALPLLASRGARFKAKASKTGNIRATTSYGKRDLSPLKKRTPRPSTSGKSLEEEEEEEYDDEEEQRVIFGSSLLMEAKTAKGIEISIEEHQIEMTKPPFNSSTTMGDR